MFYFLAYIAGIITLPVLVFIFDQKEQVFLVRAKHKNGVQNERRFTDGDHAEEWINGLLSHGDYMDVELSAVIETPAKPWANRGRLSTLENMIEAKNPAHTTGQPQGVGIRALFALSVVEIQRMTYVSAAHARYLQVCFAELAAESPEPRLLYSEDESLVFTSRVIHTSHPTVARALFAWANA